MINETLSLSTIGTKPLKKPKLRGYFHREGFFGFLGAFVVMTAQSTDLKHFIASIAFSLGMLILFGISATYHVPHWTPEKRAFLRRLDHAAIFGAIWGGFVPFCLLALPENRGYPLLEIVSVIAVVGILQSLFWVKAPKWFMTAFSLGMAWSVLPYIGEIGNSIGQRNVSLMAIGGGVYTFGALCYALKRPRLKPTHFGYHELFHVCTLFGSACFFFVIYQMIH